MTRFTAPQPGLPPVSEGGDEKMCDKGLKCRRVAADSPSIAMGPRPATGVAPDPQEH